MRGQVHKKVKNISYPILVSRFTSNVAFHLICADRCCMQLDRMGLNILSNTTLCSADTISLVDRPSTTGAGALMAAAFDGGDVPFRAGAPTSAYGTNSRPHVCL